MDLQNLLSRVALAVGIGLLIGLERMSGEAIDARTRSTLSRLASTGHAHLQPVHALCCTA